MEDQHSRRTKTVPEMNRCTNGQTNNDLNELLTDVIDVYGALRWRQCVNALHTLPPFISYLYFHFSPICTRVGLGPSSGHLNSEAVFLSTERANHAVNE